MNGTEINRFNRIKYVLNEFSKGEIILIKDGDDREDEIDFVQATKFLTPKSFDYMRKYGSSKICQAITPKRAQELDINLLVQEESNTATRQTGFLQPVDHIGSTTTGESVQERVNTYHALMDPKYGAVDFSRPGHGDILLYRGGIKNRKGHTEASIDCCLLTGLEPYAVLCPIVDNNYNMVKLHNLTDLLNSIGFMDHKLIISIEDMDWYMNKTNFYSNDETWLPLLKPIVSTPIKVLDGKDKVELLVFSDPYYGPMNLAVVYGNKWGENIPVRIHSECCTSELLGSIMCDCCEQRDKFYKIMKEKGCGIMFYMLGQEGRSIGLVNKVKSYKLQIEKGMDTYEANKSLGFQEDARTYRRIPLLLKHYFKINNFVLYTNDNFKINVLKDSGLTFTSIPLTVLPNPYNLKYMNTKMIKKHRFDMEVKKYAFKYGNNDFPSFAKSIKVGIIRTIWNKQYINILVDFAIETFKSYGLLESNITITEVEGSLETIHSTSIECELGEVDAILILGIIQEGETSHDKHLSVSSFDGFTNNSLIAKNPPITCGILTIPKELPETKDRPRKTADQLISERLDTAITWAETVIRTVVRQRDFTKKMSNRLNPIDMVLT